MWTPIHHYIYYKLLFYIHLSPISSTTHNFHFYTQLSSSLQEEKPEENCLGIQTEIFHQMRPSFVVSLLILALLLTKAQAIRLGKGSLTVEQEKHDEETTILKRNNNDVEEAILCKDEQCTGNIKNRKLVTTSISTTKSLSKNVKNREDMAHPSVKSLNTSKHSDLLPEDFAEINEMDYSPARRKTPIHN